MSFWKNKKVLLTGGAGFLGTRIIENLSHKRGVSPNQIIAPRSQEFDLRIGGNCRKAVKDVNADSVKVTADSGFVRIDIENTPLSLTILNSISEQKLTLIRGSVKISVDSKTEIIFKELLISLYYCRMTLSWIGVFRFNGQMFTSEVFTDESSIIGSYSLHVLNTDGVILLKIDDIQTIHKETGTLEIELGD